MTKIYVTYDPFYPDAVLLLDGMVEKEVKKLIDEFYYNNHNIHITYGSTLPISQFRVFINEGVIKVDDIEFEYLDSIVEHDSNGRFGLWPSGFCDYDMKLLDRLLCVNDKQT